MLSQVNASTFGRHLTSSSGELPEAQAGGNQLGDSQYGPYLCVDYSNMKQRTRRGVPRAVTVRPQWATCRTFQECLVRLESRCLDYRLPEVAHVFESGSRFIWRAPCVHKTERANLARELFCRSSLANGIAPFSYDGRRCAGGQAYGQYSHCGEILSPQFAEGWYIRQKW